MKNIDSSLHTTGKSAYIDDFVVPADTLYGHVFYIRSAHARIDKLDLSAAAKIPGVVTTLTANDIQGDNQIGSGADDEPLFAENAIHFWGQPIALVVAETSEIAREASHAIACVFTDREVITEPRDAARRNEFLIPPVCFSTGDVEQGFAACTHVISGTAETGGQEHLYLEPQGAVAIPTEQGVKVVSSTQGPTAVQRTIARVLKLAMHQVEVEVGRLGGAFGGKEDQATVWAVMAALAASKVKRAVKLVLDRPDDMRMTGKRHPYTSDFRIGLDANYKILAYEADFFQNGGAATDLSPPVLYRSLFHSTNAYFVPNVKVTGYSCRTNLPPNTAFRGFGGPQGIFVIEAAIQAAAEAIGVDVAVIQKANLLDEGQAFHYGQVAERCQARRSWAQLERSFAPERVAKAIEEHNANNRQFKKGMAITPICFGISFTKTAMNQAGALVHIYSDGSIAVSTGAVEMGQGVNTKILQTVALTLGVDPGWIRVQSTNTSRIANTSPTAASAGADLNGKAAQLACLTLKKRLLDFLAKHLGTDVAGVDIQNGTMIHLGKTLDMTWKALIGLAFEQRVALSAHAQYATPNLHFDLKTKRGAPFAYHVYGAAMTEVTVDTLRGRYTIDRVSAVHDFGQSLNPAVDLGQVEGALLQGIGWMTLEELRFDRSGRLMTDTLSTYKVPDIYSAPCEVLVEPLECSINPNGLLNSKAVGEPPFIYGIGSFMAIRNAMRTVISGGALHFCAPWTPEWVLTALYPLK